MTTRRRLLAGLTTVAVGSLAGCVGEIAGDGSGTDGGDDGSTGGGSGGSSSDSDGDGVDPEEDDGLTVEALSVEGSPGGTVPVAPDRVTLLDFFATWCAPCKPQMEELRTIDRQFPDVHLLSVTRERDEDAVRSFWREYEGTWSVGLDPDLTVFSAYQAGSVPTMVVLDATGEQRWRHSGLSAADSIAAQLEAAGAGRGA